MDEEVQEIKEEPIAQIKWSDLLSYLHHGLYRMYLRDHKWKDTFPGRLLRAIREITWILDKQLEPMSYEKAVSKVLQNKTAKVKKVIVAISVEVSSMVQHWLLAFMRDLLEVSWDYHLHQPVLMHMNIILLRIIENYAYLFDDDINLELVIQILTISTLRDSPLQLMLNSIELQDLLFRCIDLYFLTQREWNPFTEVLLTIACQLATFYDFCNQTKKNIDLIKKVIQCYKFVMEQQFNTRKLTLEQKPYDLEPNENDYMELGLEELLMARRAQNKKKHTQQQLLQQQQAAIFPDDQSPIHLFQQVPQPMILMLQATMATFPTYICDLAISEKHDLYTELSREPSNTVFFNLLSLKILQAMAVDPRCRNSQLLSTYSIIENMQKLSRQHDFFILGRESLRVLNNLLYSFDEMVLWLKFDTKNIHNDNSNFIKTRYPGSVEIKPFGDPLKLPLTAGLYWDGCGIDFRVGDGLEIVGLTNDYTPQKTLKPGLQLPDQVSISFWFVYFSQQTQKSRLNLIRTGKVHTLITCSDGITPLMFSDPTFMMMGVSNVGDKQKAKQLGIELQPVGLKFFEINLELSSKVFQGWNHVIVSFDNVQCQSSLYVNGHTIGTLNGIYSNLSIKYVGNCPDGQEPFGYLCDMRVYPRLLDQKEIKYLCTYDKTTKLLCNKQFRDNKDHKDILSEFVRLKVLQDLRRIIQESYNQNPEACSTALQCVSLICFSSTRMRLEAAKQGVFELASTLVHNQNSEVSRYAKQVMVSVW